MTLLLALTAGLTFVGFVLYRAALSLDNVSDEL